MKPKNNSFREHGGHYYVDIIQEMGYQRMGTRFEATKKLNAHRMHPIWDMVEDTIKEK